MYCLNALIKFVWLEKLTQASDMDVYGALLQIYICTPYPVQQL